MKNFVLFSVSLFTGIFMLIGFSGKKMSEPAVINSPVNIVECQTPANVNFITTEEFNARYATNELRVRRNADSLSQAEINAIKVGILKMRALPYTNPTSYTYQSAIHGTTLPDNLLSWNMCHRSGEGVFFFAWHRMYLFFFERILRAKSGRANLTLPYWNYQLNPVMPYPWRDKTIGNPLYNATRSGPINNGGALPSSISTAINNSLALIPYYTFQGNFNSGPHGSVHTSVAGDMAVVATSVKDPVFWLHHSNVDRLWEQWRSMCGGRTNPTDATWLNKTYTFFDEYGTPVNMTGSQVVEISTQLGYRYDDRNPVITCPASRISFAGRQSLIKKEATFVMAGQTQQTNFSSESPAEIESFIATKNRRTFNFNNDANPERLTMILEGVGIEQMPQGVIEIYLNLPAGATPVAESNYFVGLLDLFSAQHHAANHTLAEQATEPLEIDVTRTAQALGLTIPDLRNATVTFITRGLELNGREVRTTANVVVRHIRFSVDRYSVE
ncbi:MAG: tyrosinase family protein [Bacteroidota bacterium]